MVDFRLLRNERLGNLEHKLIWIILKQLSTILDSLCREIKQRQLHFKSTHDIETAICCFSYIEIKLQLNAILSTSNSSVVMKG